MSTYRLERVFSPGSVAVVGASPRETSPGRAILRQLGAAGFPGPVHLINPHYDQIEGVRAVKSIAELPLVPDLIVIAAPSAAVPSIVEAASERGIGGAIIITSGLGHGPGSFAAACEQAARASGLRLMPFTMRRFGERACCGKTPCHSDQWWRDRRPRRRCARRSRRHARGHLTRDHGAGVRS